LRARDIAAISSIAPDLGIRGGDQRQHCQRQSDGDGSNHNVLLNPQLALRERTELKSPRLRGPQAPSLHDEYQPRLPERIVISWPNSA
jgi:hypothetical protein